jgi:hypothetical protein
MWIFILLAVSWTLKIYIHPYPIPAITPKEKAEFWNVLIERAHVGIAPGWLVIFVGFIFNLILLVVALGTRKFKDASSEVQPSEELEWHPLRQVSDWAGTNLKKRNTIRRAKKARQRIRTVQTEDKDSNRSIHYTEFPGM